MPNPVFVEREAENCYTEVMNGNRKLPIGIQSFEELRKEGYLYVDKTDLVYKLVTEGKSTSCRARGVSARVC